MKKTILFLLTIVITSQCFAQFLTKKTPTGTSNIKELYSSEQLKSMNEYVKEIEKTKEFKSVELYCPEKASHAYFKVRDKQGQTGLLYKSCANKANESNTDATLIPMNYSSFEFHGPSDRKEPYRAYSSFGKALWDIYYYHKVENEIVIAELSDQPGTFDVYAICNNDGHISSKCILSKIDGPVRTIPGYIVTGAEQQYGGVDHQDHAYYFANLTTKAPKPIALYDMEGNTLIHSKYDVIMICFVYEDEPSDNNTPILFFNRNKKFGAGLLGKQNIIAPCIFADAYWNEGRTDVTVKCTPLNEHEVYQPGKSYEDFIKDPKTIIYTYCLKGDVEGALNAYNSIPKDKLTSEDAFYAASACFMKANADHILIEANILALKDNLSSKIYETPNPSITSLAINTAYSLIEEAKQIDSVYNRPCDQTISALAKLSSQIDDSYKKFDSLNTQRIKKQNRAQFWGALLTNIANQAINYGINSLQKSLTSQDDKTTVTTSGAAGEVKQSSSTTSDEGVPNWAKERYNDLEGEIERTKSRIEANASNTSYAKNEIERLKRLQTEYIELKNEYDL